MSNIPQRPVAQPNNPLHGRTLESMVTYLRDYYGWPELARLIPINCFKTNPTVKSSLKFLRKKEWAWARKKVEYLFLELIQKTEG